ncbi:M91 family zinc metallopeptidase [Vineibacter terrae]|uniref:M91 family zinc metallopeptidase n=1 Tax=Vineibacter terrae TaxID=2586908 RepID=UPI002E2F86D8|nr:M91 family zinc metallopeptidase [Vineibacter terrae]HEX2886726.1 M91 family zinc metallopeptidase [Vineibacter terrae]
MMDLRFYNLAISPLGLVGPAQAQYVRQVQEHLDWIHRAISGRLLLDCIRRAAVPVEIRPFRSRARSHATGGGELKPGAGAPTGFVSFSPAAASKHGALRLLPENDRSGRLPDEILFHELVHVMRNVTGTWDPAPPLSAAMRHYGNNEEFIAVLCTNIYVSDGSNQIKSGLRAGHQGYAAMDPGDALRFGLFASSRNAFALVGKFCADNPLFTKALGEQLADIPYNPVAEYYAYREVCAALSTLGAIRDRLQETRVAAAPGRDRQRTAYGCDQKMQCDQQGDCNIESSYSPTDATDAE